MDVKISKKYAMSALLCSVFLCGWSCSGRTGPTVEEVKDAVESNVHIGSDVGEVTRFLQSRSFGPKHFIRGPYYNDPKSISVLITYTSDKRAQELKETLRGYMVASIPDVSYDFFNKSSIVATFYFDRNDRLIDETVREELGK